jgi:choline kinase
MKKPPLVFIPAAGLGKRAGSQEEHLPKPIISVGDKPLIYRVMSLYPSETHFVIGLGYKGEWVKQVAKLAAAINNQKVTFFTTDSWKTPYQGLSHTVLEARKYINSDFVFHAVDTLISQESCVKISNCSTTTVIFGKPNSSGIYRTIVNGDWNRISIEESNTKHVYVGIAFIKNDEIFWESIESELAYNSEGGEVLGINPQSTEIINIPDNEWLDCGSKQGIAIARPRYETEDIVLERSNEAIWKIEEHMYKFHESENFVTNRILRADALQPFVPKSEFVSTNIYKYLRAPGVTLSNAEPKVFKKFLEFCLKFWFSNLQESDISDINSNEYDFKKFYFDKTKDRVAQYLTIRPNYYPKTINGCAVQGINETLELLPWDEILSIYPCRAHGDLHPENVVHDRESDRFTFLDWRQDIAGSSLKMGDLYYELGKIKHGLIVDHGLISEGKFKVLMDDDDYEISVQQSDNKKIWMEEFEDFVKINEFDSDKIDMITGLIFVNIAALHHSGYNDFLFTLGHSILAKYVHLEQAKFDSFRE